MLKKYDPTTYYNLFVETDGNKKAIVEEEVSAEIMTNAGKASEEAGFSNNSFVSDNRSAITCFFEENGITITTKSSPSEEPIMYLVNAIAECLPLGEDFLHLLRKAICNKDAHFEYNVSKLDSEKRRAVTQIANIMKNCGVFSQMIINTWNISGNVSSAARVKNFLSGVWLELYSQQVAINVVKKYAKDHNMPYEVYSNLIVEDKQGVKHEIDLMFSIGNDMVFGAEIKYG